MSADKNPSNRKGVIKLASGSQFNQIGGNILYDKKAQAYNTIRIKRDFIRKLIPDTIKSGSLPYTMVIPKNYDQLKKALEDMDKDTIPILLYLYQEK